jgi:serine/threonine-protein kinase HipA
MVRPKSPKELLVYMNGEEVGRLSIAASGQLRFSYASTWLQSEIGRSLSISLPLSSQSYRGPVVESFFDNLLPDNASVRVRMQARFGALSSRCFDLLWHAGRDCVGAIQLVPESEPLPDIRRIEAHPLTDSAIADILQNYATVPLGMVREDDAFRISLAGAQEKTALLWHNGQWCRPVGATPTSHIIKLPIGTVGQLDLSDSVENEWLCHMILKAYGIPVADAARTVFDTTKALVVTRFDRRVSSDGTWIIRLPQEDLCQALAVPPAFKYESDGGPGIRDVMELLLASERSESDRYLFMKTQILFWLLAAIDGHGKNFSVFLLPGDKYHLTPMYDVISAHPMVAGKQIQRQRLKMSMAVSGKNRHYEWERIHQRHWAATAQKNGFPRDSLLQIFEELLGGMHSAIEQVNSQIPAGFPSRIAESIFEGMILAKEYFESTI